MGFHPSCHRMYPSPVALELHFAFPAPDGVAATSHDRQSKTMPCASTGPLGADTRCCAITQSIAAMFVQPLRSTNCIPSSGNFVRGARDIAVQQLATQTSYNPRQTFTNDIRCHRDKIGLCIKSGWAMPFCCCLFSHTPRQAFTTLVCMCQTTTMQTGMCFGCAEGLSIVQTLEQRTCIYTHGVYGQLSITFNTESTLSWAPQYIA